MEKFKQDLAFLKHLFFSLGGFDSSSGDLSWADPRPWPVRLPQWCLLRLRDWRDLPGGWEPVHPHNGQPRHTTHFYAPRVWHHRPVHYPYSDTLGAITARLHSTAHQDPTKRCSRNPAQYRSAKLGQFWPQPQVSPAGHIKVILCCSLTDLRIGFFPFPAKEKGSDPCNWESKDFSFCMVIFHCNMCSVCFETEFSGTIVSHYLDF